MQSIGTNASPNEKINHALRLRNSLVLNAVELVSCANEVFASMPAYEAEAFKVLARDNALFRSAVKMVTADVAMALAVAKSVEEEIIFEQAVALVLDSDLSRFNGRLGRYVSAMVEADKKEVDAFLSGAKSDDGSFLNDMMNPQLLQRRLNKLVSEIKKAHNQARI